MHLAPAAAASNIKNAMERVEGDPINLWLGLARESGLPSWVVKLFVAFINF